MKNQKAIRDALTAKIKELDGGVRSVAEQMDVTERYIQGILSPKNTRRVRLATFEKIDRAVKDVQDAETKREQALLI